MNEETDSQTGHLELIDATQNAVMEAIDNVSELMTETAVADSEPPAHHEVFYKEAEFWVGFAFILVVIALARPVARLAKSALAKRRDEISNRIGQAEKLHDDAQKLWAEYERKFLNAGHEADEILEKSNQRIERTKAEEISKFEDEIARKSRDAENLMSATQARMLEDINVRATDQAVETARKYLERTLDESQRTRLIDDSIDRILAGSELK